MIAAIAVSAEAPGADPPRPWTELGSDGTLSVRIVLPAGAACPKATVDGSDLPMLPRASPGLAFPITLCEVRAPAAASKITVADSPAPTLPAEVKRIVVIGDTGCRLEGRAVQDCNDPEAWPFATIARRAAAHKPDLVIHVGDYYYRETACPTDRNGCTGSPHGDGWATWQADFFDPAAPLLAAAPWVLVRGNHELCSRGGEGWVRLLDPHPGPLECAERSEPYRLHLGGLDLLLFDGAGADDFKVLPENAAAYAAQLAALLAAAPPHAWLVTHRPVWALAQGNLSGVAVNATEEAAIRGQVPPGLDLVLSGHLHDFLSYEFGPERPAQLVVGDSGDTMLELGKEQPVGAEIDGAKVRKAFALERFGFFVLDRTAAGWDGTLYDTNDTVLARCQVSGRDLECR